MSRFPQKTPAACLRPLGTALVYLLSLGARPATAADVIGHIDGLRVEAGQVRLAGWACQPGNVASLRVHVYADRAAADKPAGTMVLGATADLANEPAVDQACQRQAGGRHRFLIALPADVLAKYQGRKLYVHGIRAEGKGENSLLEGSGELSFPAPPAMSAMSAKSAKLAKIDKQAGQSAPAAAKSAPPIAGSYTSSSQHPRVFTNQAQLTQLAKRINASDSFSAQNFSRLSAQVKKDLAAKVDWDAVYSGCDLAVYLHTFSYEHRSSYAAEARTEQQLKSALQARKDASAPAGAALVAARLALYAALLKAGAKPLEQAPGGDAAAQLAKRILLAWAERGLRDAKGERFHSSQQFCGNDGKPDDADVGLQLGRGVMYSVQAQDMLQALGILNSADIKQLNGLHLALFDLIRQALNRRMELPLQDCERYSNHSSAALSGMLSIARLLDDNKRFNAVLKGGDAAYPVALPWLVQFNQAIYGEDDSPVACYPNPGKDSLSSKPSFQTATVVPGEVEDRYRNSNPLQGIGYPMFSLELITNAAEILQQAGFDAWGYRGAQQQSIGSAIAYYACYGKTAGFNKTVTAENAKDCPNYEQYVGKVVNGVESMVLVGSARYPGNAGITAVEAAARKGRVVVDGVRFGMWRD